MHSQPVERISWKDLKEYNFDNIEIEIPLENIEKLQNEFIINGKKLKEFLETKKRYIIVQPDKLILTLKNFFGEISFSYEDIRKKGKIVPLKIFPLNMNPKKRLRFYKKQSFLRYREFSFIYCERD